MRWVFASILVLTLSIATTPAEGASRASATHWDSAAWDSAAWDSAAWDSAAWDSAAWDSAAWDSAAWDSAAWDSAAWDSAAWDSAAWDSASWDGVAIPGELAPPWGLVAIGATAAWERGTPTHNVLVCIVDSGIDASHPALRANLWTGPRGEHGWNAILKNDDVRDESGHGTALAGIVAAARGAPWPGVGAPLVASVKALGADGTGRTSDVTAGIQWCAAQRANVILLALSEDAPTKEFKRAIEDAQRSGALVVAAAGNGGPCRDCVTAPASMPRVLGVGSAGPSRAASAFSAGGPDVDLLAPGERITSTVPGGWRAGSGTSQAAAFAAGATAFLWGACPAWSADEVAHTLVHSATRVKGAAAPLLSMQFEKLPACPSRN